MRARILKHELHELFLTQIIRITQILNQGNQVNQVNPGSDFLDTNFEARITRIIFDTDYPEYSNFKSGDQ